MPSTRSFCGPGRVRSGSGAHQLRLPIKTAVGLVDELGYQAKEEVMDFSAWGFDDSSDLGFEPEEGPVRQVDRAALVLLRRRVALHAAARGLSLLGDEGMLKDAVAACDAEGGLAAVGLELAARSAPLMDAPWCVGGRPSDPAVWGEGALFGLSCDVCPVRASCPGLPAKGRKLDPGALRPLPHWSGVGSGTALVCGGAGDPVLAAALPQLAEALSVEGLEACYEAEPADLLVCGDAVTAARLLAARRAGQRIVVLDDALGHGLAALPEPAERIVCATPGYVGALTAAGVDLRTVLFRPALVPSACADAPAGAGIVAIGELTDAALRDADVARTGAHVTVVPPDGDVLAAILGARVWFYAARRPGNVPATPEAHAALARDLRWLGVAQAAGKPVLAVRAPGVEDHVRHDRTGWLCPATGPAALAEALRRILEPARHARYAAEARALGARSLPTAWAKELVRGVLPTDVSPRPDATRRWPVW